MEQEQIYFDEEVRGHKLLVTSHIIAHKGKIVQNIEVDCLTISVYRHSVNAIPTSASYIISVGAKGITVEINTARAGGFFWLGKQQFDRLRVAVVKAVGYRLLDVAIRKLYAGQELIFEHRRRRITVSPRGVGIEQSGVFRDKELQIPWQSLRMIPSNGSFILQSYENNQKINIPTWTMPNNFVFQNLLNTLLDKARYRSLVSASQI